MNRWDHFCCVILPAQSFAGCKILNLHIQAVLQGLLQFALQLGIHPFETATSVFVPRVCNSSNGEYCAYCNL